MIILMSSNVSHSQIGPLIVELAALEHLKCPNKFMMDHRWAIVALWATCSLFEWMCFESFRERKSLEIIPVVTS